MRFDETAHREKALETARESLAGMFDGLLIIGTWQTEEGKTATLYRGDGNWHAQNGMIDYLLHKRRHEAVMETEGRCREDSDEHGAAG